MDNTYIKKFYSHVPQVIRVYLTRALLFLAGWLILYAMILKPTGIPDKWLTEITAKCTVKLSSFWYEGLDYKTGQESMSGFTDIFINGKVILRIADGCNALDLIVLYISFLFCAPTNFKRILAFGVAGILLIFSLNVIRCTALIWIAENFKHLFDFAHKYVFTAIVYCFIFGMWVAYAKKIRKSE